MASINRLTPGQKLFDVKKGRYGEIQTWTVEIISVNLLEKTVMAKWNGNPVRIFGEQSVKKWKVKRPVAKGKI